VIKKAIAEVNKKSDLVIKAIYQTSKHKTTEIAFAIRPKWISEVIGAGPGI
jgi:hypothetical protein